MLHLFKEIYLNQDTNINLKYNRIVISAENGYPTPNDEKLLAYGKSVEDLIGEGKQFPTFLDLLIFLSNFQNTIGDSFIQIYADRAAFVKLSAYWLKALFDNGTADSAYDFLKCYQTKISVLTVLSRSTPIDPSIITRTEFAEAFNGFSEDVSLYTSFISSIATKLSIEILVAAYLANGSLEQDLSEKLRRMIVKDLGTFFKEMKSDILYSALREDFKEVSHTADYTIDNLETMVHDPSLDIFFKLYDIVISNADNDTNDWSNVTDSDIDYAINHIGYMAKEVYCVGEVYSVDRLFLIKQMKSEDLITNWFPVALDWEIRATFSFFSPRNPMFNGYFMDYILEPIRAAKLANQPIVTTHLLPYSIRGIS